MPAPWVTINPLVYHVRSLPWQYFCTLTFKGYVPGAERQRSMFYEWGRRSYGVVGLIFESEVVWGLRAELGDRFGRGHLHALVSSFNLCDVDAARLWRVKNNWPASGGGIASVRPYSAVLPGAEYIFKGFGDWSYNGANLYELERFGTEGAMLSRLAWDSVRARMSGPRYRRYWEHCVKRSSRQALL